MHNCVRAVRVRVRVRVHVRVHVHVHVRVHVHVHVHVHGHVHWHVHVHVQDTLGGVRPHLLPADPSRGRTKLKAIPDLGQPWPIGRLT